MVCSAVESSGVEPRSGLAGQGGVPEVISQWSVVTPGSGATTTTTISPWLEMVLLTLERLMSKIFQDS